MDGTAPSGKAEPLASASHIVQTPVMSKTGRRQLLKSATSAAHTSLDGHITAGGYFNNPESFRQYLVAMHAFQLKFVQSGSRIDRDLLARWSLDRHLDWIEADLQQFEASPNSGVSRSDIPAPRITCRSSLIGAIYTVAGSSLGARVLHRWTIERALPGPGGSSYLAFIAGSIRWKQFEDFLDREQIDCETALIDGANSSFESVLAHLDAVVPA